MRQRRARSLLDLESIKIVRVKVSSEGESHLPVSSLRRAFSLTCEICRLRRSLHNFTFLESVAISLVIGAGVGSIACLIMMLFILCCRRLGLSILSDPRFGFESKSGVSKETQNAITEADCKQMVSEKEGQMKGQGGIKLFERDEVIPEGTRFEDEHLPEYEEGEDAPFIKEKDLGV